MKLDELCKTPLETVPMTAMISRLVQKGVANGFVISVYPRCIDAYLMAPSLSFYSPNFSIQLLNLNVARHTCPVWFAQVCVGVSLQDKWIIHFKALSLAVFIALTECTSPTISFNLCIFTKGDFNQIIEYIYFFKSGAILFFSS